MTSPLFESACRVPLSTGGASACELLHASAPSGHALATRCCGVKPAEKALLSRPAGGTAPLSRPDLATGCGAGVRRSRLRVEARLYKLLRRLPSGTRRALLARGFTEPQRLALERWILAMRPRSFQAAEPRAKRPRRAVGMVAASPRATGDPACCCGGRCNTSSFLAARSCQRCKGVCGGLCSRKYRIVGRSGVPGIECHRRNGRTVYRASAAAGPFRLHTEYSPDLASTCRFLRVVRRICDRVGRWEFRCEDPDDRAFEQRFRRAVAAEQLPSGGASAGPQLRFFASVPARSWVGGALKTPCKDITGAGLEEGILAWRRLLGARAGGLSLKSADGIRMLQPRIDDLDTLEAVWCQLRRAYVEVWEASERSPGRIAARVQQLERTYQVCKQRAAARAIAATASLSTARRCYRRQPMPSKSRAEPPRAHRMIALGESLCDFHAPRTIANTVAAVTLVVPSPSPPRSAMSSGFSQPSPLLSSSSSASFSPSAQAAAAELCAETVAASDVGNGKAAESVMGAMSHARTSDGRERGVKRLILKLLNGWEAV